MKTRQMNLFIFLFLCTCPGYFCQKSLQLDLTRLGKTKTLEIFIGDEIHYKLKTQSRFRKNKIANLQDSLIIFTNDSSIVLSDVRIIRFKKTNLAAKPVQNILLKAAIVFPLITTVNRALRQDGPYLREGAAIVSLSCLSLYLVIERLQIKRAKINKSHTLRIVDYNYKNLNLK